MTNISRAPSKATVPRRVLIVEDEILIAMVLEDVLDMLGHTVVGNPSTYAEAESAIAAGGFDLAILDVHLGHDPVFPLADRLHGAGTAIIFTTGAHRDSLPPRFAGAPILEKPYAVQAVETALGELA